MDRWRRDDVAAVATQIDPLRQTDAISGQTSGMSKIEMTPVTAGDGLDRCRERPELVLQPLERGITAMFRIDIKHDQI
jgi:hypothetical protein